MNSWLLTDFDEFYNVQKCESQFCHKNNVAESLPRLVEAENSIQKIENYKLYSFFRAQILSNSSVFRVVCFYLFF